MEALQRYTLEGANVGRWDTIHNLAANADQVGNIETKRAYAHAVGVIVERHYCEECRTHGINWLRNNPAKNYFSRSDGCLYHSWRFHDSVSKRIGKPSIAYKIIKQWYSPTSTNGCMAVHDAATGQLTLNARR